MKESTPATYSSVTSPTSATSPSVSSAGSAFFNSKFTFPNDGQQSPQGPGGNRNFRQKSFQNTFNPPSGGGGGFAGSDSPGFHRYPSNNYNNQQQQQPGVKLFIKANNVTEELLRSLFNANVSQAKILSIDVKTK